jgi:Putative auto-transporter adhesin, head GIN domain
MRLLLPALLLAAGLATQARAETINRSLDGSKLELRLACVKSVEIQPAPALSGKVEIIAEAASQDELAPLDFSAAGGMAKIERTGHCISIFTRPTLTIAIKVPAATPIDLRDAGSGKITLGPVGGPLKIDLAGSGVVEAANATDLDLRIAGSGDLKLARLDGPARIDIRGSGDAGIDAGALPSLDIDIRGSGSFKLRAGDIGTVKTSIAGSGDVTTDGTVKDATLSTTGSGDIKIAKATGEVHSSKAGSGDIRIGK